MSVVLGRTLLEALAQVVARYPERTALIAAADGARLTYRELALQLDAVFDYLKESGAAPGETVSLIASNSLAATLLLLGAMRAGYIVSPIAPSVTAGQLANFLEHSHCKLLVTEPGFVCEAKLSVPICELPVRFEPSQARSELPWLEPQAGALLVYTSGTLGAPKGVLLRHSNILANVATALEWLPFASDHRTLTVLPLFHTFAIISDLLTMVLSGRTCVIGETFDIQRLQKLEAVLVEHQVNSFSAAPLIFDLSLKLGVKLSGGSLRFCVAGAAPLSAALTAEFFERYAIPIIPAYGMTETSCFACISPVNALRAGSCGKPAGCEIRIVDEAGRPLPSDQVGELQVRGDSVMTNGYLRSDVAAYDRSGGDGERPWLVTGDLGRRDPEGYVFIVGRKKNMVIRGGEKIYLEELDSALSRMPGVLDTASVGVVREPVERVVTFVVPSVGTVLEAKDVLAYLHELVGPAKCPDRVEFATRIPRTPSNKVKVAELVTQAESLFS